MRKKERVTILEKEKEEMKQKQLEYEQKKIAEDRRRATLRVILKFNKFIKVSTHSSGGGNNRIHRSSSDDGDIDTVYR